MNGYIFPRSGKHANSALSANRNETRRPKQTLGWRIKLDWCFLFMDVRRTVTAMGAKLWRAVQRRRGARSNYYRNHQESGA